ncbi:hypothetical protein Ancab_033792 [Ancistrocladus abbreviatus]
MEEAKHDEPRKLAYKIFISHKGKDTKNNFASLVEERFSDLGISAFLDRKSLKAGQNLVDKIENAIKECEVGLVVFSPRFCDSRSCLRELARMLELEKRIVPIFWDVKPENLKIGLWAFLFWKKEDRRRFKVALELDRKIVGLEFNSKEGNWPEFLQKATSATVEVLSEVEVNRRASKCSRLLAIWNKLRSTMAKLLGTNREKKRVT